MVTNRRCVQSRRQGSRDWESRLDECNLAFSSRPCFINVDQNPDHGPLFHATDPNNLACVCHIQTFLVTKTPIAELCDILSLGHYVGLGCLRLGISHVLFIPSQGYPYVCVDRCVLYRRTRTIPDSNCDPHPLVSLSTRLASLTCALSLTHSLYSLLPCLSCFKLRFIHST